MDGGCAPSRHALKSSNLTSFALNTVRSILQAAPGLKTMADIPPIAFFNEPTV